MAGAPAGSITAGMPGITAAVVFAIAFIIDARHSTADFGVLAPASVTQQRLPVVEEVAGQRRITAGDAAGPGQRRAIAGGWPGPPAPVTGVPSGDRSARWPGGRPRSRTAAR